MGVFVVETGTGDPTATSYTSVEYADAYHTQYGNTVWTTSNSTSDKQDGLNAATQVVDAIYGMDYKGPGPYTFTQKLLFPRFPFYINQRQIVQSNQIPTQLQDAVCEIALIWMSNGNIWPDMNPLAATKYKQLEGGTGIMSRSEYFASPTHERIKGFLKIERILRPILNWDGENDDSASITMLGR